MVVLYIVFSVYHCIAFISTKSLLHVLFVRIYFYDHLLNAELKPTQIHHTDSFSIKAPSQLPQLYRKVWEWKCD